MRDRFRRNTPILFIWALLPVVGMGQSVVRTTSCSAGDLSGRAVGTIKIRTAFDGLHLSFIEAGKKDRENSVRLIVGKTYTDVLTKKALDFLRDRPLSPLPFFGAEVSASVTGLGVDCVDRDGKPLVDLTFYYFPASIPSFFGYSHESRAVIQSDAAPVVGAAPRPFSFSPLFRYSESVGLAGGFSAGTRQRWRGIQELSMSGNVSDKQRELSLQGTGSYEAKKPSKIFSRASFLGGFDYRDEPAGSARIQGGSGFLEWTAASRAFSSAGIVFRYGAGSDLGIRRSYGVASGNGTVANSRLGRVRGLAGLTRGGKHESFSISYALEGGRTGRGGAFDFARQFFDASHSWWIAPHHYPIEFDARFNLGQITNVCRPGCGVPLAERFFGGNFERQLIHDPLWNIAAQPYIRSLPANSLGAPAGGEMFRALNLTAAFAVYRRTLIPSLFLKDRSFMTRIDGISSSATESLASFYAVADEGFRRDPGVVAAKVHVDTIAETVASFRPSWDHLGDSISDQQRDEYTACSDLLDSLPLDIQDFMADKYPITIFTVGNGNLSKAATCLRNMGKADAGMVAAAGRLDEMRGKIQKAVEATDVFDRNHARAVRDMATAKSTIHTLFHETNFLSVSPVIAFDSVTVGAIAGQPKWRHGLGGGVRFILLSTLRLTVGYSRNLNQQRGERPGAVFAKMDFLDIFGR